jgi:hypothetical protein
MSALLTDDSTSCTVEVQQIYKRQPVPFAVESDTLAATRW